MDRLARVVSIAFHPMVSLTLWALAVAVAHRGWLGPDLLFWGLLVAAPGAFMAIGARWGLWSDFDLSDLHERRTFLPLAALLAVVLVVLTQAAAFAPLLRFAALAIALWLTMTAVVSLAWKISMHVGATVGLVLVTGYLLGVAAAATLLWAPFLVAWARLRLGRHTPLQVVAGAGAAAAAVALSYWLTPP